MVLQDVYCDNCGLYYTNVYYRWCKPCQLNYLKNNFINWSENEKIDDFIQEMQLKIDDYGDIIVEWISYNRFSYVKETGKHDFITVYSAKWKDGPLEYNVNESKYKRNQNRDIVLKCLNNSQNTINEVLNEV